MTELNLISASRTRTEEPTAFRGNEHGLGRRRGQELQGSPHGRSVTRLQKRFLDAHATATAATATAAAAVHATVALRAPFFPLGPTDTPADPARQEGVPSSRAPSRQFPLKGAVTQFIDGRFTASERTKILSRA